MSIERDMMFWKKRRRGHKIRFRNPIDYGAYVFYSFEHQSALFNKLHKRLWDSGRGPILLTGSEAYNRWKKNLRLHDDKEKAPEKEGQTKATH